MFHNQILFVLVSNIFVFQFNLSCTSKPGKNKFYTRPDNNILITLYKKHYKLLNYNFIFNVTLSGK